MIKTMVNGDTSLTVDMNHVDDICSSQLEVSQQNVIYKIVLFLTVLEAGRSKIKVVYKIRSW
jgi:hypothetical protein